MHGLYLLRVSSLTLEINEFRCFEVKIEYIQWIVRVGALVVIRLLWLSGRALVAQARGVSLVQLPATAGLLTFLYFCLMAFT